jgi:hypothetical protein
VHRDVGVAQLAQAAFGGVGQRRDDLDAVHRAHQRESTAAW